MRKNLSQQKLLEILTSEIETLKQTTENINEIAPEIARQLHALKTTKVKIGVDTGKLEQLLEDHKQELEKSVIIPRWFGVIIVTVIIMTFLIWILIFFYYHN
jgi:predicted  nucleic acid-binding Zn-ribbon protein